MAFGMKSGVTHAARYAFWSRRVGNYALGNNSATSDITAGDQAGALFQRAEGLQTFEMNLPEPPRLPAVGDGGTLVTIIGAITETVGGTSGYVVLDIALAAATDGRLVYTLAPSNDNVIGLNVSEAVPNDLIFVVSQQAKNRDTSGSATLNESTWLITEFLNVNAVNQFASYSGTAYDANQHPYSLTFNESDRNVYGTQLTTANYGYANHLALRYYSPNPVFFQTWKGDGTETTFNIDSSYVPAAESGDAVLVAVNGTMQTYTTNYTVSGLDITFATAPAFDAIITAHVKF